MKRNTYALVFVTIMAVFATLSCKTSGPEGLLGKWQQENGQDQIEFGAKGAFHAQMADDDSGRRRTLEGTYFVDADKISIDPKGDSPMTWRYKFADGDLVITYEQGGVLKLDGTMAKFKRQR